MGRAAKGALRRAPSLFFWGKADCLLSLKKFHSPVGLALKESKVLDGDALWLRYVPKK